MNAFLDGFASLMDYFVTQWQQILSLTIEHIEMTAIWGFWSAMCANWANR